MENIKSVIDKTTKAVKSQEKISKDGSKFKSESGESAQGSSGVSGSGTGGDPFQGLSFKVGVAENKNTRYRSKMEDVHTYIANFAERVDWGYFAIFDGHAGKDTARWCGNNMHMLLEREIEEQEEREKTQGIDMKHNLHQAFVKADAMIETEGAGNSGCTAVVAVLRWEPTADSNEDAVGKPTKSSRFDFVPGTDYKRMLYTSNVGDSRIVLFRAGKPYRLSYDHKATDSNEINRIRDTGGLIMKNRVNGVLAVTRSLGDSYMKDLVIGKPFTTATEITVDDDFMILACDGVWDVISDLKACKFVAGALAESGDVQEAAKKLCQLAMDSSTTDNVTVMIVKFDKEVLL